MQMFVNEGTCTPDSLIVSPDFPVLKEGIGLKPGQGTLKRGTIICKGTDGSGYIAGKTVTVSDGDSDDGDGLEQESQTNMTMKVFGILTDDTETGDKAEGDDIPAVVYTTGIFNRAALSVYTEAAVATFEDELKGNGIHLRNVQTI